MSKRKTWIAVAVAAALVIAGVVAGPPLYAWWQDRTWESAVEDAGDAAEVEDDVVVFAGDPAPPADLCESHSEVEALGKCLQESREAFAEDSFAASQAARDFAEQIGLDEFAEALDTPDVLEGNLVETHRGKVGSVRAEYAVDLAGQFTAYFERVD